MQLMNYSIGLYDQLKAEGADGIGWHKVGSLRPTARIGSRHCSGRSAARAGSASTSAPSPPRRRSTSCRSSTRRHRGRSAYSRRRLDGSHGTLEFAARARELGVVIETNCRVTGITTDGSGAVTHVETNKGTVQTAIVINAAGHGRRDSRHGRRPHADGADDAPVRHHAAHPRPRVAGANAGRARPGQPVLSSRRGRRLSRRRLRAGAKNMGHRRRRVGLYPATTAGRLGTVRAGDGGGAPAHPVDRTRRGHQAHQRPGRRHAGRPILPWPRAGRSRFLLRPACRSTASPERAVSAR